MSKILYQSTWIIFLSIYEEFANLGTLKYYFKIHSRPVARLIFLSQWHFRKISYHSSFCIKIKVLLSPHSYLFVSHYKEAGFFSWEFGYFVFLHVKALNTNRFYWLHALGSYEFFRLVCSCKPVPTEMVNHRSGVWSWRWTSQFGSSSKLFFFSLALFTVQQRSAMLLHIFLFPFASLTFICVVLISPNYLKVGQQYFYKIQLVIINSLRNRSAGLTTRKSEILRTLQAVWKGSNLLWCLQHHQATVAVPASHSNCLPPVLQSWSLKCNPFFVSAPWRLKLWDKATNNLSISP